MRKPREVQKRLRSNGHLNPTTIYEDNNAGLHFISPQAASGAYGIPLERIRTLMDLDIIHHCHGLAGVDDMIVEQSLIDYINRSLDLGRLP